MTGVSGWFGCGAGVAGSGPPGFPGTKLVSRSVGRMAEAKSPRHAGSSRIPNIGNAELAPIWSLVTGYWPLATGYWLLATGHWSLVTGHWPLVTSTWLGIRLEGGVDGGDQLFIVERLLQEIRCATVQGPAPGIGVVVSRNEDDRHGGTQGREFGL